MVVEVAVVRTVARMVARTVARAVARAATGAGAEAEGKIIDASNAFVVVIFVGVLRSARG